MDDDHHQPIWPMIQGAANYAWNLIEEAWTMVWKPVDATPGQVVRGQAERVHHGKSEMREVVHDIMASSNAKHDAAGVD
jgi:hypothetical protein